MILPGQYLEKPLCTHYSEPHAFQTAAMAKKSKSAELRSCERHTSPKGSISRPTDQLDYECTVPCSTDTMETPCKWAWECKSHGHQKGKQVSFITATQPIHSTDQKKKRTALTCAANFKATCVQKSSILLLNPSFIFWSDLSGFTEQQSTGFCLLIKANHHISITFIVLLNFTGQHVENS